MAATDNPLSRKTLNFLGRKHAYSVPKNKFLMNIFYFSSLMDFSFKTAKFGLKLVNLIFEIISYCISSCIDHIFCEFQNNFFLTLFGAWTKDSYLSFIFVMIQCYRLFYKRKIMKKATETVVLISWTPV